MLRSLCSITLVNKVTRDFAKAVCNTSMNGIAYQWYPTGLLKYSALNTNVLPAVSTYTNPFSDIDWCSNKARMIYEFEAQRILQIA